MTEHRQLAEELIAEAEKRDGFRAGIAAIDEVLDGPSYKAEAVGNWKTNHSEKTTPWLPNARSLLVLAMHHPEDNPRLDWFDRGNNAGNRRMTEISEELGTWIYKTYGVRAQPLPYHVEKGGVYLKDAAVFAGLGVVGKNNLLLDRKWGPRVRLRAVLIEGSLPSGRPPEDFQPCQGCAMPCRTACPANAFALGQYDRPSCIQRLDSDRAHPIESGQKDSEGSPILVTDWCRRCEFACPVGEK
jgi:epoxyqueuosine reductase